MNESSANEPLAQVRHIDRDGGRVPVEGSPVPAGPATLPLVGPPRQGPNRLVLRASYRMLYGVVPFTLLIVAAVMRLDRLFMPGGGRLDPAALWIGVCMAGATAWLAFRQTILPRVTFDRQAGLLILGWGGLRGRRPLASVVGVQVLQTRKRFGGPEQNLPTMTLYQFNLILDDPAEPRLNVTTGDPRTALIRARAVADFLGVPLLDSTAVPESVGPTGAVEQTPLPPGLATISSPVVTEPRPGILFIRSSRFGFVTGWHGMSLVGMAIPLGGVAAFLIAGMVAGKWPWDLLPNARAPGAGQGQGMGGDWCSMALLAPVLVLEGIVLLGLIAKYLGSRAYFDRERGVLTLGWLGRGAPRPLASIKAVQVVDSTECQLNLVLDDARQPRLNLITGTEPAAVRKTAERVASFLGVPLVEAARPASPATGPEAGAAPNYLDELNRAPLPAGRASIRGPAHIVPKGDDGLVLRPRRSVHWLGLVLGLMPFLVLVAWLGPGARQAGFGDLTVWLCLLLIVPLGLFRSLRPLFWYRDHFDRQTGVLTLGWFGLKGTQSLENVLAVQLIPAGLVDTGARPFSRRGGERVSYQMNLVLADIYQSRLNLTDDADLAWTREAGQQLADFLGVPLVDQIAEEG